eukprot:TRINITY_DN2473_c0_g1_i2.p1 TRINITY_DN2473_c0_g1~~TRINITY_DN2473_c0_g1_i2.p1  ORF type:complete len:108 (-),score=32.50 TRINITY_DN2473_c0_g1_i2:79-402(-)
MRLYFIILIQIDQLREEEEDRKKNARRRNIDYFLHDTKDRKGDPREYINKILRRRKKEYLKSNPALKKEKAPTVEIGKRILGPGFKERYGIATKKNLEESSEDSEDI